MFPQYAGSLRPSEFEGRSRSAPVSALTSPLVSLRLSRVSAPEALNRVHGGPPAARSLVAELARPRPAELACPRPAALARLQTAGLACAAHCWRKGAQRPKPATRDPAWDEEEEDA
jgi:hypothetical protein